MSIPNIVDSVLGLDYDVVLVQQRAEGYRNTTKEEISGSYFSDSYVHFIYDLPTSKPAF
jgi:hypothetical protein